MQGVIPSGTRRDVKWVEKSVVSDWGGDGEVVADTTDSISATLRNIGAFTFEYRVDSGNWARLEPRNAILLDVSLATSTIRLRRAEFGGSGIARLEIESLTGVTIDEAGLKLAGIDVGAAGGAGPLAMSLVVDGVSYQPTRAIKVRIGNATYFWPLFGPVA